MAAAPHNSSVESFHLALGAAEGGQIHAFGRYWVWGQTLPVDAPPLRLLEWTDHGIVELPTDSSSLHRVKAGTPHFIDGLFGYWLISDADQQWLQALHGDRRSYGLIAGGATGGNRVQRITWYCQECGTQLREPEELDHDGTVEDFLAAQERAVTAFNLNETRRRCPKCHALHPPAYGFRSTPGPEEQAMQPMPQPARSVGSGEPAARLPDLQDSKPLLVEVAGREIALVRSSDQVFAIANRCPHKAGPLAGGLVRSSTITCPWHWFRFDLQTGVSCTNPLMRTPVYETELRGDEVFVHVPAAVVA